MQLREKFAVLTRLGKTVRPSVKVWMTKKERESVFESVREERERVGEWRRRRWIGRI